MSSNTKASREAVFSKADELNAAGVYPSVRELQRAIGGSFGTVHRYQKEWKALMQERDVEVVSASSETEKLLRDSLEQVRKDAEARYRDQVVRLRQEMDLKDKNYNEDLEGALEEIARLEQGLEQEKALREGAESVAAQAQMDTHAEKALARASDDRATRLERSQLEAISALQATEAELDAVRLKLKRLEAETAELKKAREQLERQGLVAEREIAELRGRLRGQASRLLRQLRSSQGCSDPDLKNDRPAQDGVRMAATKGTRFGGGRPSRRFNPRR